MIFALITTQHPTLERCNEILTNHHNPLIQPLFRMLHYLKLHPTPPPYTKHILDKFYEDHSNLLSKPTSIHEELYDYIAMQQQPTFAIITTKFPFFPSSLIYNAITYKSPILGYTSHPLHPHIRHLKFITLHIAPAPPPY